MRGWRQFVVAVGGLSIVASGCGRTDPSSATGRPGVTGTSYLVTVSRQPGGTVTSADGRINCGTAATATACGPATYAWSEAAVLTAIPDPGFMFGTWAGDCSGRGQPDASGNYTCTLDTSRYGADKYVVAVFGDAGRTQHTNFSDPRVHGPEFLAWVAKKPDTFDCAFCHGSTYAGVGIAPSCTTCHQAAGFPNWLSNCGFCHSAPPPSPHPQGIDAPAGCYGCHPSQVPYGQIAPGMTHMNGQVDGGGHADGYVAPAVHGRDFFAAASSGVACQSCHGSAYDSVKPTVMGDKSCNTCHETVGWIAWQTNCTFCHGTRTLSYTSANLALSAPPDAISQRLTGTPVPERTGAHAAHLTSAWATVQCGACHGVPTTLTHISGRDVRAAVVLNAPGQAAPDPEGYLADGTCATTCHRSGPSPAWASTAGLACNGCHAVPPATAAHSGVSGANLGAECSGCHPNTISPDGSINLAAGGHINGTVDRVGGHEAGFAAVSLHGPQYLDNVAGKVGALNCQSCHTGYSNCTSCHSSAGWSSWQTNCTFCHGTKTYTYTDANLSRAAPPDAVSQRLTGVAAPTKTGKHSVHLSGRTGYPPLPCATCHPVPTSVSHISVDRLATVQMSRAAAFPQLTATQLANLHTPLPDPLATYDRSTNTCSANYCHGSTMDGGIPNGAYLVPGAPRWTTFAPQATCANCHGNPPDSGALRPADMYYCGTDCTVHFWHNQALPDLGYDSCDVCHHGNSHVNGMPDIGWAPTNPAGSTAPPISGTWDPVAKTCAMACHSSQTPRSWYAPTP